MSKDFEYQLAEIRVNKAKAFNSQLLTQNNEPIQVQQTQPQVSTGVPIANNSI